MMDDLRPAAVAARVVAWHNRHPLARRIAAAQVHAVGYVGLPFVGAAGSGAPAAAAAPPQAAAAAGRDTEVVDLGALEGSAGEAGSRRERALAHAPQQGAASGTAATPAGPAAVAAPAARTELPALATLTPDFSEDFIDPLRPREVARFAARAGQVLARPPGDGPVREVPADGAHPGRPPARVYLLTAVVETGTRKSRVLTGIDLTAPVLGWRIFDTRRVAALAGLAGLVVGVPAWLLQPSDDAPPPQPTALQAAAPALALPAAAAPAAPTASAADLAETAETAETAERAERADTAGAALAVGALATAAASGPLAATAAAASHAGHAAGLPERAAADPAAAPAWAASAPVPRPGGDKPALRTGGAPSIRPVISEEAKAQARQARQALLAGRLATASSVPEVPPSTVPAVPAAPAVATASAAARQTAAAVAPAPAPAPAMARAQPPAPPATAAALPAPGATAFALSTRPLRTRAEADQVQVAMRALLRSVGAGDVKVDVLPQGDDWRVVALPFPQRAAADKARALLVSRGMRVEVLDF